MAVSMPRRRHQTYGDATNAMRAALALTLACGIKTRSSVEDTPEVNVSEIELQGATVYRVKTDRRCENSRRGKAKSAGSNLDAEGRTASKARDDGFELVSNLLASAGCHLLSDRRARLIGLEGFR